MNDMYKTICLRPCTKSYETFVKSFIDKFKLTKLKENDQTYYLENADMLVRIKPTVAEVFMHHELDYSVIKRVNEFFDSYC
jgi:hypothetical protein